jgi:hypothetical protein
MPTPPQEYPAESAIELQLTEQQHRDFLRAFRIAFQKDASLTRMEDFVLGLVKKDSQRTREDRRGDPYPATMQEYLINLVRRYLKEHQTN